MRRRFWIAAAACLMLGLLGWAALQNRHALTGRDIAEVPALAPGHQEIAWFAPATSGDSWERLVAALKNLEKEWGTVHVELPQLRVSFDDAFLDQTAAIPQIALTFRGFEDAKLWIRWYKLSGEIQQRQWLDKLHNRGQPPLAIIGGDSSDQALNSARELQQMRGEWDGPLFLVTAATLDRFYEGEEPPSDLTADRYPKFMDVYKDRTFRFCFTNEHIAHAVLDFIHDNPQVWPRLRLDAETVGLMTAQTDGWARLTALAASSYSQPVHLSAVAWEDDHYSQDLANRMFKVFVNFFYEGDLFKTAPHYWYRDVEYSVGGFYQPNPREQQVVDAMLRKKPVQAGYHHLLALPTGVQPARRLLRTLCRRVPMEVQDLVVVTGDSISFNNVYRDGDLEWNVLDMPVPLVFFSHRNPMDEAAGFRQRSGRPISGAAGGGGEGEEAGFHTTGTHDLLLQRDVVEALVQAAWDRTRWAPSADAVRVRLKNSHWNAGRVQGMAGAGPALFDVEGNRNPHTGEHVVWLQPVVEGGRNLPRALLSVWRIDRQISDSRTWQRVGEPIIVNYNQAREAGNP